MSDEMLFFLMRLGERLHHFDGDIAKSIFATAYHHKYEWEDFTETRDFLNEERNEKNGPGAKPVTIAEVHDNWEWKLFDGRKM